MNDDIVFKCHSFYYCLLLSWVSIHWEKEYILDEEHPTSCSSKMVFLFKFHLATNFKKRLSSCENLRNTFLDFCRFLSIISSSDGLILSRYIKLGLINWSTTRNWSYIPVLLFSFFTYKRCSSYDSNQLDERSVLS